MLGGFCLNVRRLVKTKNECEKVNFSLKNGTEREVIDSVYKQESDLGILFFHEGRKEYLMKNINDRHLSYNTLGTLSLNVNLRKDHPLMRGGEFDFSKLKDYPFVHYINSLYSRITNMEDSSKLDFVNLDKEISIFDRETKCKIVTETDAYSIGCKLHPNFLKYFDWVSIAIPGILVNAGYIINKNEFISTETQYFLDILKEELSDITL
jgi:hypothetical protein